MKCYVITWSTHYLNQQQPHAVNRQHILDSLDKISEARNWRASTGAIFIASEGNPKMISDQLHRLLPHLGFVLLEIKIQDVWGWTDKETWEFIQNPRISR